MSEPTYAGKTFVFRVDNGVVFRNTYAADGTTLHYEAVEGPTKGSEETVTLHTAEVAPGLFMVGWVEKSGMTVTHLLNLDALTVHAFWTYETGDGRVAELHTGTLEPA
ncbi:MoaF-related domain-containing protein [Streptomyces europaeiscabiei]|uniref:MoaF-related domain-containing protein n=1 Tax=Streptomyces europaeiscabiei TaxID=146819 RepID=UPI0029BE9F5A|nr:MoaF N-terminal domain-containing protein [Streptomyces europaeiscabiei]MDX2524592.1 MoaF N-terminal domain-containing protein [Streptomyces europaeiscabiei]MDX3778378.1 MoaF N-terminal domain-containing protein [Streptomyces europaeiscabiei]